MQTELNKMKHKNMTCKRLFVFMSVFLFVFWHLYRTPWGRRKVTYKPINKVTYGHSKNIGAWWKWVVAPTFQRDTVLFNDGNLSLLFYWDERLYCRVTNWTQKSWINRYGRIQFSSRFFIFLQCTLRTPLCNKKN